MTPSSVPDAPAPDRFPDRTPTAIHVSNGLFFICMSLIGGTYALLIVLMLAADCGYMLREAAGTTTESEVDSEFTLVNNPIVDSLQDRKIRYSIWLSMLSCSISAILSLIVAIPLGYLMSRCRFPGRAFLDALLDIPIVLPPLVIGLSLLILFQFAPFAWFSRSIVYQVPAVILAQFSVACAFAVRTMKQTFDQINSRCEKVAISLGCSRVQALGHVVLPEADRGMMTAFTLAWARSLGEFGPLLIFAGATRMKTEVLSTSVFLEMNIGNLRAAVAVSMIMVATAIVVLILMRMFGTSDLTNETLYQ